MAKRIDKVQEFLNKKNIDALLLKSKTMKKWMSTMLGSGCKVLITKNKGYLILDGRYITEAKETEFDLEIILHNPHTTGRNYLAAVEKILKDEKRAAFSVIGDEGYPYTIPINFYYEEADHTIYFHGAREGHKMDAIQKCNKVCLTTWNQGFKKEGHWEWNATSVVVFGKAELITDTKIIEDRLRKLAEKYYPTVEEVEKEMNGSARSRVQLFAIRIEHMTGKLVNEK